LTSQQTAAYSVQQSTTSVLQQTSGSLVILNVNQSNCISYLANGKTVLKL